MVRRVAVACTMTLTLAVGASAQTGSSGTSTGQNTASTQTPSSSPATDQDRRRGRRRRRSSATLGCGLLPTAEVLPSGKWSVSGYRRGTNYIQGYTNVADFAGTFAVGIKDRAEIFGSFLVDTRIDRDTYPLFFNDPTQGGVIDRYPRVNQHWTGDNVGDLYVGVKLNLLSEYRQNPAALALRGMVKVPTGKKDVGVSTGKADVSGDFIVSKDVAKVIELTGYAGYEYLGSPDGFDDADERVPVGRGRRVSVAQPGAHLRRVERRDPVGQHDDDHGRAAGGDRRQHRAVRVEHREADARDVRGDVPGAERVFHRRRRELECPAAGAARQLHDIDEIPFADYWDWQVRIGYHPGVRVYVAAAAASAAPAATLRPRTS